MSANAAPLENLIEQFAKLSGIGRKGAARLAYQVLSMDAAQANAFADAIRDAHEKIRKCEICHNFTEQEECVICRDALREQSTICVVESPKDVSAFEHTREYKGLYHVLHGLISPTEGIGPEQLGIQRLLSRVAQGDVTEVIMATNPTVEGEATALYLSRLIKPMEVRVTRLAYGLPVGGNLEYVDDVTLYRALMGRDEL